MTAGRPRWLPHRQHSGITKNLLGPNPPSVLGAAAVPACAAQGFAGGGAKGNGGTAAAAEGKAAGADNDGGIAATATLTGLTRRPSSESMGSMSRMRGAYARTPPAALCRL
jgi:hypothetical protein